MIPLPRYVRPVKKPSGRTYYFFQKYRSTAQEWPSIRLPDEAAGTEFAQRITQCGQLSLSENTLLFTDVCGRQHSLPTPKDHIVFWAAVDRAEDLGRRMLAGERKTFRGLILEYKESAAYQDDLSAGSKKEYDRYLTAIEAVWGDDPVAALTPVDAQRAIDAYKDTPAAGRYFRAVLSRLISWGIPRGYREDNPVEHTEKAGEGGTYSPWPDWAFELMMEHGRFGLQLPVFSGLYTGQRSVDVMKMRRPGPSATEMPIYAQKTGRFVPVQVHSEYRRILNAATSNHIMLHLREDGTPWTIAGFRTAWQRDFTFTADDAPEGMSEAAARAKQTAFERMRAHRVVFHGLRKNAVIMLLEAGCTEAETGAIVGMSEAMVRHYSIEISSRRLAVNAMKKLEANWGDIRRNLFGGKAG